MWCTQLVEVVKAAATERASRIGVLFLAAKVLLPAVGQAGATANSLLNFCGSIISFSVSCEP